MKISVTKSALVAYLSFFAVLLFCTAASAQNNQEKGVISGRSGNTMTLTYKGTVSGDSITGSMSGGQMARDFTAKRTSK
jgi:hypothetical protein